MNERREEFMQFVYGELADDETNDRANRIIDKFDELTEDSTAEQANHGEWLSWTTSRYTGNEMDNGDPEYKDFRYFQCADCKRRTAVKELYCPSCGRKMDGGSAHDT